MRFYVDEYHTWSELEYICPIRWTTATADFCFELRFAPARPIEVAIITMETDFSMQRWPISKIWLRFWENLDLEV